MATWKNISIAGAGVTVALSGYMYYILSGHHSHFDADKNAFPYMKTRTKAFPWECADCGLFDSAW